MLAFLFFYVETVERRKAISFLDGSPAFLVGQVTGPSGSCLIWLGSKKDLAKRMVKNTELDFCLNSTSA